MNLLPRLFRERLFEEELGKFITFPGEKVILGVREHYASLLFRLIKIFFAALFAALAISVVSFFVLHNLFILVFSFLLIMLAGLNFVLQEMVHWYLHIYLVTNRKMAEVKYHPLVSETTDSILLDQIKCTEIDAELYGYIAELLNLGDVKITFDRPTLHEKFVLKGIHSPRGIANLLSRELNKAYKLNESLEKQNTWYKDRLTNKLKFMEQDYGYSVN